MELRVLFRNSVLLACVWQVGCTNSFPKEKEAAVIPSVYVQVSDAALQRNQGTLYYKNKIFSGWILEQYPNGDTARLTPYFNGKEEGGMKTWYLNKQLSEQRFFVAGKKDGVHKGWWPDGAPKFEYHFHSDEHEGEVKEWFSNGTLSRLFHYKKGHEDGRQQMWWENGKVRANYVVKDGEQYGLIGRKLCKN